MATPANKVNYIGLKYFYVSWKSFLSLCSMSAQKIWIIAKVGKLLIDLLEKVPSKTSDIAFTKAQYEWHLPSMAILNIGSIYIINY